MPEPTKKAAAKESMAKPDDQADEKSPTAEQEVVAALAEVDDEDKAHGEFAGVKFEFLRKTLDSIQWRRLMQRNKDLLAIEWLIGSGSFNEILTATADEDGLTMSAAFDGIWEAIGAAAGTGNSGGSTS